jgi:hypothetical protein
MIICNNNNNNNSYCNENTVMWKEVIMANINVNNG